MPQTEALGPDLGPFRRRPSVRSSFALDCLTYMIIPALPPSSEKSGTEGYIRRRMEPGSIQRSPAPDVDFVVIIMDIELISLVPRLADRRRRWSSVS